MTARRQAWRLVFLTYPCPTCGVRPGEDCVTKTGLVYRDVHAARTRHSSRCPRCGSILAAFEEPGQLCGKCALLRRLEVERMTMHIRRDG